MDQNQAIMPELEFPRMRTAKWWRLKNKPQTTRDIRMLNSP